MKKIQFALVLVTLMLCLNGCTTSVGQNTQNSTIAPTEQPLSEKKDESNKEFVEKNEETTATPVPTEDPIVPAFSEEELATMVNTNQTNGEYEYFIRWNAEWSYYIELVRCFEATIPAYIDGIPVKVLGSGSYPIYESDGTFYSITVPEGVAYISNYALRDSRNLKKVNLPDSVISIGEDAFAGTPWESSLEEEYTIVGDGILYAANLDKNAKTATIPDGVKDISYGLFEEHKTLESIVLPEGITVIPESVIRIDISSFERKLWRYDNLNVIGKAGSYAEKYVNEYTEYNEESYIKGITMTFQVSE